MYPRQGLLRELYQGTHTGLSPIVLIQSQNTIIFNYSNLAFLL
jgi:hypothetical protein